MASSNFQNNVFVALMIPLRGLKSFSDRSDSQATGQGLARPHGTHFHAEEQLLLASEKQRVWHVCQVFRCPLTAVAAFNVVNSSKPTDIVFPSYSDTLCYSDTILGPKRNRLILMCRI